MAPKIVIVGSFNMDLTSYTKRMPRPGETVSGDRFITGPGGKGSNQAVAAARLGADVTFVGRVGQDSFGDEALKTWQTEGINTQYVTRDPEHSTGVAPIWVDETGENMIVVVLGANRHIQPEDIDAAKAAIAEADVLVVQLEINYDMVEYALKTAKELGVRTILNPAPAGTLSADVIALADFITPNETELEVLSQESSEDVVGSARSLLSTDAQAVVVTLGAQGAQFVNRTTSQLIPTYKVDAVDTTGAGDAFNGGFAVALAEGKSVDEAIRFANATAALCVTKPGTAPSMPKRNEVDLLVSSR